MIYIAKGTFCTNPPYRFQFGEGILNERPYSLFISLSRELLSCFFFTIGIPDSCSVIHEVRFDLLPYNKSNQS